MKLKFIVEDREYHYDGKLSVRDARFIHEKSGVGLNGFNRALLIDGNPDVIAAMIYLLKRRAGEAVQDKDIQDLDLATFNILSDEDEPASTEDEEPAEEAENPTQPNSTRGKTRKRGTSAT